MTNATRQQVRKHYQDLGYEVRIDAAGHVSFRNAETGREWLSGRWVSEYHVIDGKVVLK